MLTENMKHQATIDNNQVPNNLYHFVGLNSVAVEYLWEAGFNAVNSIAQIFHSHHTGTPAWVQALNFGGSSQEVSDVLEWLESKGAPMDWIHPTFGTTPLHVFVRRLADIILRPRISDEMDSGYRSSFSLKAMLSDYRDSCVCPCSDGGCAPITCAIQETIDSTSVSLWVLFDFGLNVWYSGLPRIDLNSEGLGNRAAGLVSHLFSQVDACENNLPWLGGTILRVMTFERLHLTHTCCRFIGKELGSWPDYLPSHTRPCREEAEEIHESEGKYIDVLENLLPQFEQQWKQYHGKFADFIKNVWEVRMGEEDTNLTGDPREERAKIRELGVVLDPYESEDSDGESVYEDAVAIPFGPERPPEMQ
ncbi:hypothetical protein BDV96DRAFT_649852 [Lophiotrema nucula]|uniref:Uncharacterized protein n=1 Tax=Lophiotrema nucula TaxID=690887 RepID=A0A6A5YYI7_9PLEO|nr:hypothetical protein BDV96DRAFT_649852 [Lophiotrema nucula]